MKVSRFFCRILCLVLISAILIPAAVADTVDLSLMSDDEVVALMKEVNDEIVRRRISKTATLLKGTYVAGDDLPAGKYIFTCLATGDEWGNVNIYESGTGKQIFWEIVTAPENGEEPETMLISLNEGDQLKSSVPFSLTVMTGVLFE